MRPNFRGRFANGMGPHCHDRRVAGAVSMKPSIKYICAFEHSSCDNARRSQGQDGLCARLKVLSGCCINLLIPAR